MQGFWLRWLLFWSLFYGLGAPLFQVAFVLKNGFLNQFSLMDFITGPIMLVSAWGLWRRRPWARLLNAICWGAFLAVFVSALSYFAFFLKDQTPPAASYVTGLGVAVAASCIYLHLRGKT